MTTSASRRALLGLGAALPAAGLLAACGSSGGRTVQFVGPELPKTFAPVIAGFERAHPGVTIRYTSVPFDRVNDVLQARLGAKDAEVDVFTVDPPRVSALAARGFLKDLTGHRDEVTRAVLAGQADPTYFRGRMWTVPIWSSTQFLYYNADLLAKAGVAPPGRDPVDRLTWERVVDLGRTAQKSGAQYGLLLEQTDRYYQLQPLPASLGGGSGISRHDELTPAVTNDAWVRAMRWYRELFASGAAPRGVSPDQMGTIFSGGHAAFLVGGPWNIGTLSAQQKFRWGIAPHPYFADGKPVTPTDSWTWGVNPYGANAGLGLDFVRYAGLTRTGSLDTIRNNPIIPANAAAFPTYKQVLERQGGSASRGVGALMEYELTRTAIHRPRSIGYIQFEDIMNKAFADIRNGADPAGRLGSAAAALRSAWGQLR